MKNLVIIVGALAWLGVWVLIVYLFNFDDLITAIGGAVIGVALALLLLRSPRKPN